MTTLKLMIRKEGFDAMHPLAYSNAKVENLFESCKRWQHNEHGFHGGVDAKGRKYEYAQDVPFEDRRVFCWVQLGGADYFGADVEPTPELWHLLKEAWTGDTRDFMSVKIVQGNRDKTALVVMENSLIIGSRWVCELSLEDVKLFFKNCVEVQK